MGTPRYEKKLGDVLRELQQRVTEAQASAQNREPFAQASQGINLPNLLTDPPAPTSGVVFYAKAGHAYCREQDGSIHQLTS